MNGNDRRRLGLSYPELSPTAEQLEYRRDIACQAKLAVSGTVFSIMVIGVFLIVILSSKYPIYGFYISLFGVITDVILGALLAYNLGNKITKIIQRGEIAW